MERVKKGDTEAFRQLIEAHQMRVIGTVARMLGDETDAEDVAQQVFIRVWKSAPRYEPRAKFTTWLFKITRNLVFNELRRRKRHPVTSMENDSEDRPFDAEDLAGSSARMLPCWKPNYSMRFKKRSIPCLKRSAWRLCCDAMRTLSYEEIGEVLNLSPPAVKSVLFRARAELRSALRSYLGQE